MQVLRQLRLNCQVARACLSMANNVYVVIVLWHHDDALLNPHLHSSDGDRAAVGGVLLQLIARCHFWMNNLRTESFSRHSEDSGVKSESDCETSNR